MDLPRYYYAGEFAPFEDLFRTAGARPVVFEAGDYLTGPGKWTGQCYYVQKGLHILSGGRAWDSRSFFWIYGPGSLFPFVCSPATPPWDPPLAARAVTRAEALVLSTETLTSLTRENGDLALAALRHYSDLQYLNMVQRVFQSREDSLFKVGSFLYMYSQAQPEDDRFHLTQEQVGSFVGLSRMQISRVFRELRENGFIATGRNWVQVTDPDGLRDWCLALMEREE